MKASDLFVKALENEGVEYIFGIPGEENLDVLESLRKSSIKLIVTRHEQAAGFMAATYGRLTGKPGVCLSTLGPGATNLLTAAAYAQLGAMPMLMITGQKPVINRKQAAFQVIDVVDMMKPVTKLTRQIFSASTIAFRVREAFRMALHEAPGAVHLELPEDIAQQNVEEKLVHRESYHDTGLAVEEDLDRVADLICKAQSPIVMIGANAKRNHTCEAISDFIKKTGIPFFCTQMGKGVVDERSKHYLGTAALSQDDYVHDAIREADLVLNIGHDIVEKPPFYTQPGDGKSVIHVNYNPAKIVEVYQPRYELVGDIGDSVRRLSEKLSAGQWDSSFYDKLRSVQDEKIYSIGEELADRFPITPQNLVKTVRELMPDDSMLALDNGMYKVWFARNYKSYHPDGILLDNALASMGAGLPSAIAAKMVHPERKVMAICGDGGFMMNSAEMETAVRLGLDLTVLIVNDQALGMIRWKQEDMGFENYGLGLSNPDFVKYAESYGAHGHRVDSAKDFGKLLKVCVDSKGVHLIEVPVDYSENHKVFDQEIKNRKV